MKHREYFLKEWVIIKLWAVPVAGMALGGLVPLVGFFIALLGYAIAYPVWKADPQTHRNLQVFATLALVLSFVVLMGFIYFLASGILAEESMSLLSLMLG